MLDGRRWALDLRPGTYPRRWVLELGLWTLAILAATALPELLARVFGPQDLVRVHTFLNIWDFNVYLSAMREAARTGGWLVHNHYASPPHQPALIHVPYVGIGLLARALGTQAMSVYVVAEALGRILVVAATFALVRLLLPPGRVRLVALCIALLGSGLSFWTVSASLLLGQRAADMLYYETNMLAILFSGLHLMIALALTVAIVALYTRLSSASAGWPTFPLLGATSGILTLIQPHNLPVLGSAFCIHALALACRERRVPRATLSGLLALAIGAAPVVVYDYLTFARDPVWSVSHFHQNVVPSPQGLALLGHLGLPLLLGLLGLVVWREGGERRVLVGALILSALVWMYAPLPYQRRFAFALPLYLAVPAAIAVEWLRARVPQPPWLWRRALGYGLVVGMGATSIAMYLGVLSSAVSGRPYPSYPATRAELAAAEWLAQRMRADEVVLSGLESGYLLGGEVPGRVALGHPHETPHFTEMQRLVAQFFDPATGLDARLAHARAVSADFVFYGPLERQLGPPPDGPGFERIYKRDGVTIYQVSDDR